MCAISLSAAADPALIAARQKVFGIENVDANTGAVKGNFCAILGLLK
jgi:hypothetical protein